MMSSEDRTALILEVIQTDENTENGKYNSVNNQENTNEQTTDNVNNENFTFQSDPEDKKLVSYNCLTSIEILKSTQQIDLISCENKETFIKYANDSDFLTVQQENSSNVCAEKLKGKKHVKKYVPCVCPVCQKIFSSKKSLKGHTIVHSSERPYVCRMCYAAFKRKSHLLDHDERVHKKQGRMYSHNNIAAWKAETGEFSCDKCEKVFTNKYDFKRHSSNKHNINSCDVCDEHFLSFSSLYRHKIQHKGTTTSSLCEICGKLFKNKYYFKIHLKCHSNEKKFICEKCGKRFVLKCYLTAHMIMHSDYRPFACSHCAKRFRKESHLILHLRTHTCEKPYVCNICNCDFAQIGDMKKHKRTHKITSIEE